MYNPLPDALTVAESKIHGLGLFAKEFIPAKTNLGISHVYHVDFDDSLIILQIQKIKYGLRIL